MNEVVDARGLLCPLPVIRLARAAAGVAPGTLLTIWCTDPAARLDVAAWARMRGHTVLRIADLTDGALAMDVRIGDDAPRRA